MAIGCVGHNRMGNCCADGQLIRVLADWRPLFRDIIFTTRADSKQRQPSPCSWRRCGIVAADENLDGVAGPARPLGRILAADVLYFAMG